MEFIPKPTCTITADLELDGRGYIAQPGDSTERVKKFQLPPMHSGITLAGARTVADYIFAVAGGRYEFYTMKKTVIAEVGE